MAAEDRLEAALDRALEMTFPASDAVAITAPQTGSHDARATALREPDGAAAAGDRPPSARV